MRVHRWVVCLLLAFLTSGCWDGIEVDRRALIMMVSLDRVAAGVQLGVQIVIPQAKASAGGGSRSAPTFTRRITAPDTAQAMIALKHTLDRQPFWGHVQVVLVGATLAREGVWRHLVPLLGATQSLRQAWFCVVKGEAAPLLEVHPPMENIPPTYLANLFANRILMPRPFELMLGAFHQRRGYPGQEPIGAWIKSPKDRRAAPEILGLAAFKNDRFVGGIDLAGMWGWLLTQNQLPQAPIPVPCPDSPGTFETRLVSAQVRIRPIVDGGRLLRVRIGGRAEGRVEGQTCADDLTDPAVLQRARSALQSVLSQRVRQTVRACQRVLGTDVIGIGKAVYRHSQRAWSNIPSWEKFFTQLQVDVDLWAGLDTVRGYRTP